jgi:hypothetical protein
MADERDKDGSVREPIRSAIVSKLSRIVGIVVMLYVLSPGPVLPLYNHGVIERNGALARALNVIYAPLDGLYKNSGYIRGVADWYFSFFQ